MKKNIYVVPSIMVVNIHQSTALLIGSGVSDSPANSGNSVLSREASFSDDDWAE